MDTLFLFYQNKIHCFFNDRFGVYFVLLVYVIDVEPSLSFYLSFYTSTHRLIKYLSLSIY